MEMHGSIKSHLGPPSHTPLGTFCSLLPTHPQPKPGVIDFIRCINLVSGAQEASLIADSLSELGPGGTLEEPPILQQIGEASIDHLLFLTGETPVRIGHYVLDGKELVLRAG